MRCVGGLICGARWLLNRVILYIARWLLTRVALCIVLFLFMVVNNVHFAYFKLFFLGIFFHGEKSGRFSLGKAAATEKRCPVYLWRCRIFFRILPGKVSSSPPFPLECCGFFRGVSKWRGITGPIDWTGIKAKKKTHNKTPPPAYSHFSVDLWFSFYVKNQQLKVARTPPWALPLCVWQSVSVTSLTRSAWVAEVSSTPWAKLFCCPLVKSEPIRPRLEDLKCQRNEYFCQVDCNRTSTQDWKVLVSHRQR